MDRTTRWGTLALAAVALLVLALPARALAAAPTNLQARADAHGLAVDLRWDAVPGARAYQVERRRWEGEGWGAPAVIGVAEGLTLRDLRATTGGRLRYTVAAVGAEGATREASAPVEVTVPATTAAMREGALRWLLAQQEGTEGLRVRFDAAYGEDYRGRVAGRAEVSSRPTAPVPHVTFAEPYASSYVGPVRGSWGAVADPAAYEVRVFSRLDTDYLQGTFPLAADGSWSSGSAVARAGEKVAKLVRRADGKVVAVSGGPRSVVTGLAVRVSARADVDYLQEQVPLGGDGAFVTTRGVGAGTKVARVVETGSGRVLSSTEWADAPSGTALVRSFTIPADDPHAGQAGRSYLYDDAMAALAFVQAGRPDRAQGVLTRLRALQEADGGLAFSFDSLLATAAQPYERSGALAFAGYAAVRYEEATGDPAFRDLARRAGERLLALQATEANGFAADDPRLGSVLGGFGRFDREGAFVAEPMAFAGTEHNVDAYFFLRDLGRLTGDARFRTAALRVRESLLAHHWDEAAGRFHQGVGPGGPDRSRALDAASWGGLFLLAIGDRARADRVARELAAFRVQVDGVTASTDPDAYNTAYAAAGPFRGYRPYLPGADYADPPAVVWAEGTWGAVLFELRRGEDVAEDVESLLRLHAVDPRGGFVAVTRGAARSPYELHVWPAVAPTAWATIVSGDPSWLWRPDGWDALPRPAVSAPPPPLAPAADTAPGPAAPTPTPAATPAAPTPATAPATAPAPRATTPAPRTGPAPRTSPVRRTGAAARRVAARCRSLRGRAARLCVRRARRSA